MDRYFVRSLVPACMFVIATGFLSGCDNYDERKSAYFAKGKQLFEVGDDARAQLELKNTLQIDGKHAESWYLLGRIEERASEYRKAFGNYSRALELDPSLIDARVRRAQLLVAGNQLDEAGKEIATVLGQQPENTSALVARAALLRRQGDAVGARNDAASVLADDPGNAGAAALMASLLTEDDKLDDARQVLERAIAADPDGEVLWLMLAAVHDKQGKTSGAIDALKALLARDPTNDRYRLRLAGYHLKLQQYDEAEALLRAGLAADPANPGRQRALIEMLARTQGRPAAQAALARMREVWHDDLALRELEAGLFVAAGETEKAEAAYRRILALTGDQGPEAAAVRNRLARLLVDAKRDAEAASLIEKTLQDSPRDAEALQLRAVLALRENNARQAVTDLRAVLGQFPDRVTAYRLLGLAHVQLEEHALAIDAFERAIELAPSDPLAYLQLSELRVRTGDNEGALATLQRLLEKVPDNAAAQLAIARIQFSSQDWDALRTTAQRIRSTRPDHPLGDYLTGLVLQRQGQHAEAVAAFERALAIKPDSIEPLVGLARSQLALGAPDQAEQRVLQVLQGNPNSLVALNLLGDIYIAKGDAAKAIERFDEATRFHPKSPRAYDRLAQLQIGEGNLAVARRTLERGIAETGRNGYLVFLLATLIERTGDMQAAMQAYAEVVERYPDAKVAANNLAALLAVHDGSPAALDRAMGLASQLADSDVPEFLDTLGWVHFLRGEFDKALPYLERAVAERPQLPELQYHLGMAYKQAGNVESARVHLASAVRSDAQFHDAEEARLALDELGVAD